MHRATIIERAEQHLRQMCCLATSGALIAPMLFNELHTVLPFASCLYLWLGASGPIDAYFSSPEIGRYLPLYVDEYFQGRECEVWATVAEAAVAEKGVHHLFQVLRIGKAAYFKHPLYNEILRPCEAHTFMRFQVRQHGVSVGALTIGRGAADRDFDEADLLTLARLEPFIAHAMRTRSNVPQPDCVKSEANAALVIADRSGHIRSMSPGAGRLLSLSQGSAMAPAALHDGIMRTVQALTGVERGDLSAAVPTWHSNNAWGHFAVRSYWLEPLQTSESLIGIVLERRLPVQLKVLDGLRRLLLPLRQEQVGLQLALGYSEEQAAQALGLTRNTVVYHRKQIYNRLDVASRSLLVERLISAADEPDLRLRH